MLVVKPIKNLTESQLIKVWQNQLLDTKRLVTEDGETVEIVYPGRQNDERGADFRDAVIATSQGLLKGDVEVHIRSSDWLSHQHHRDPFYNRVILHVVMWHNVRTVTRLQNRREISVLALNKYLKIPDDSLIIPSSYHFTSRVPCLKIAQHSDRQKITGLISRAGEERFLDKAGRFQRDLNQIEASQALYSGIMGALGYSKNKLPFLELANRLPLYILESVVQGEISDREYLIYYQALLLGTAGLLPILNQEIYRRNGFNDRRIEKLASLWTTLHNARAMSPSAWNLFKVRPNNSPILRLIAMSYLLLRYREKGLLEGLVGLIEEVPVSEGHQRLGEGLQVKASGCRASSSIGRLTILGSGRAADIVVNVLLPFTYAWGQVNTRTELKKKVLDLYRHYPRLPENSVERHMVEQLGLSDSLINSARYQQGLIHIYNNLCTQGKCHTCYLSKLEAGDYVQV
jgi:hypothetical protein